MWSKQKSGAIVAAALAVALGFVLHRVCRMHANAGDGSYAGWITPSPSGDLEPCAAPASAESAHFAERHRVKLRVFHNPAVSAHFVRKQLSFAAHLLRKHGIDPRLVAEPRPTNMEVMSDVVVGPDVAPVDRTPDAMWETLLSPALAFLRDSSVPARSEVLVVFLPRIAGSRSSLRQLLPHLAGMTLAPLHSSDIPIGSLLGTRDWTPAVFVSEQDAERAEPGSAPATLAHELGHVFGLSHHDDPGNLMYPVVPPCTPFLTTQQRNTAHKQLAVRTRRDDM